MIKAENLTKKFGTNEVLSGLKCEIKDGSIYGLIGANGAGKSTFLRLLCGCYYPDSGSINVDGKEIFDDPEIKQKILFVSDEFYIPSGSRLKDLENMYRSFYPGFDHEYFIENARKLNLPQDKKVSLFSKGMRRQAVMLCALSCNCSYILFDETFDGLDPVIRNHFKNLMYEKVADGTTTVVMTSHNLRELEDICDHLGVLYKGGILFEGDITNIKSNVFKVQIGFRNPPEENVFKQFDVLSTHKNGSVFTIIMKGDQESETLRLKQLNPDILDILPLTLEEVFIYEMEILGYVFDAKEFIS